MINAVLKKQEDAFLIPEYQRNVHLTGFGKATLTNQYLLKGEDYQDCFMRVAFADLARV